MKYSTNIPEMDKARFCLKIPKELALILCLVMFCAVSFSGLAQTKSSNRNSDPYSMSHNPNADKPELQYFQVRLKGDQGVSLIDLDGNIIARNFTPIINSHGKIVGENWTSPVIDNTFSIVRYKDNSDWQKVKRYHSVYTNPSHPTPINGLTNLYSANIINPNLFPISRYGERIKFVDKTGKEKFTVMPINGKEPYAVSPMPVNGLIEVEVDGDKWGAINTAGKWIIYPEWKGLRFLEDGTILGLKDDGKTYMINISGNTSNASIFDTPIDFYDYPTSGKYLIEEFIQDDISMCNVYDRDQNFIITLNNSDFVRQNLSHPDILLVRRNFSTGTNVSNYLIDISRNNKIISTDYSNMEELPDGNYLAKNRTSVNDYRKCWYLSIDGKATPLPDNARFPLRHSTMPLLYKTKINRFIVLPQNGISGFICDFNGNKVGNLEIEEFYNLRWEVEPVKSSYYRIKFIDKR